MEKIIKKLMTDSFEVKGKWFLDGMDLDRDSVEGILFYSPEKISLELIGSFSEFVNVDINFSKTIYGLSEYGEWLTLLRCFPAKAHMNTSGFNTFTYSADHFYAGTQIIKDEDTIFIADSKFSFTNLNAWMDFQVIEYYFDPEHGKMGCTMDLESALVKKQKIKIPSIGLELVEDVERYIQYPKDFFLNEKAEIEIKKFYHFSPIHENSVTPRDVLENIHMLRRLLSLMAGSAIYVSYVELDMPVKKEHCRVFFRQVGDIGQAKHLSPYTPGSILLKRSDIEEDLQKVVNAWFEERDKLGECINAYISDLYLPAYMENRFLNIIRGIETYHRFFVERKLENGSVTLPETEDLAKEYHKIVNYVETEISERNKEYFLSRIRFVDEKNLRGRLNDLFKETHPKLMSRLFGTLSSSNRKKIISKVVDTRNYYTHRDNREHYKNAVGSISELMILTEQLSILLQYFCFVQIGIHDDVAAQRLIEALNQKGL